MKRTSSSQPKFPRPIAFLVWGSLLLPLNSFMPPNTSCAGPPQQTPAGDAKVEPSAKKWMILKQGWNKCEFGGDGEIELGQPVIKLGMGSPMTGIRWAESDKTKIPRENFELELEARRTEGLDFFCGLTFPVGNNHVSLILGGWGGGVVGISSIDGYDASENDTTMYQEFKMNQWYKVRVRVTAHSIQCWIDDAPVVDQPRQGHEFDIRFEMDESLPLGIANFQCKSELRNIRMRALTAVGNQAGRGGASG